jgi:hypothetical protein
MKVSEEDFNFEEEDKRLEEEYEKESEVGKQTFQKKGTELLLTPEAIEAMVGKEREAPLEDIFGTEEATAKALIELVKTERINLLTELNMEEIQALVIGEIVGEHLRRTIGSTLLLDLCKLYKELKVSYNRKGRTEIVGLGTFIGTFTEEKKGKMGLLLGR